jgi:glycolate oxidase FAD binding subunit
MTMQPEPATEVRELADQVRAAAAARQPIRIRAGGSKDFYGNAVRGELLDPRPHRGIVAYEPSELVVTARAGTGLAELEAALAERGQMLAFEPPHFGSTATVGGCVAAGLAGPRRAAIPVAAGGIRDSVLGAKLLDGRGATLSFGGTVMKNVAGFDVSRLLAGSLGTLGVILEVSLRVAPRPAAEQSLRLELGEQAALERCIAFARTRAPVSATAWHAGLLHVRLSGPQPSVAAAAARIGGIHLASEQSAAFWNGIREQTLPFFGPNRCVWRISLPANAAALALPGEQLIEWNGQLRWLVSGADANAIRARAAQLGGHATLFRGGDARIAAFQPLAAGVARLEARLKAEFDPAGIFNPGRMHANPAS